MSELMSTPNTLESRNQPDFCYLNNEFKPKSAQALDFVKALHSAKEAQEKFKKTELSQRADYFVKWAEIIVQEKKKLSEQEAQDFELPEVFCFSEVIDPAQKFLENLNLDVRLYPRPQNLLPTGVIAIIGPRSLGFLNLTKWISQAIAAGNAVIVKPHANSRGAARRVAELLQKLELPAGLVQVISGSDDELNPLLAGHPGIQGLIYSGDFAAAESLIAEVSRTKKKAQFFLGAKNSALIHPDFDFKSRMAEILRPALLGSGQLDVNTHRFFISQNVEKEFYRALTDYLAGVPGSPKAAFLNESNRIQYEKAVNRVKPEEGHFLVEGAPSFTRDLPNCSDLQQDEIPGPLFILTAVKYVHEMVKWSNTGYFGHSAIIWGPEDKAQNLAAQLQVGQVLINKWGDFAEWGMPVKQSFWGNPDPKWSGTFFSDVKKLIGI
jgi:aminomuconate-semialdehyde/2-hydroxymuconate-6-semialdehyde dehydrogenase